MKRGIAVLLSVSAVAAGAYFTLSKWAIRHETLTFYDASRDNRPVAVDIAVRRDKELQANAGMIKLPVAVFNHGNTVKNTEYSFLANVMAARGYEVVSIQHDLPTDPPMVTKVGELYVGRLIAAKIAGRPAPPPFTYHHLGDLATIGRHAAIADFGRVRLTGRLAWWLWGLAHIYFLIGVRAPILVAAQWFWAYLTFGRGARLITGLAPLFEDPKMQPRVTDGKPLSSELAG